MASKVLLSDYYRNINELKNLKELLPIDYSEQASEGELLKALSTLIKAKTPGLPYRWDRPSNVKETNRFRFPLVSPKVPYFPSVKKERSPLGYPEYIIPDEIWDRFASPNAVGDANSWNNVVRIKEKYKDNPNIRTHERLHVGQFQLEDYPNLSTIKDLIRYTEIPNYGSRSMELAAEAFENAAETNYEDLDRFITYLKKVAPKTYQHFEAALPEETQRKYLNMPGRSKPGLPTIKMDYNWLNSILPRG